MPADCVGTRQEPEILVDTAGLSEAEWLAWRRKGIGGSDAAAILGISPWRTARDLYDDKLGIASAQDDSGNWVALEMGHLLEDLVARIFSQKTGYPIFQIKKMFRNSRHPCMLADLAKDIRDKTKERRSLLSEKKALSAVHVFRHRELAAKIATLTEDLEELRSEKNLLLASLAYSGEDAADKFPRTLQPWSKA